MIGEYHKRWKCIGFVSLLWELCGQKRNRRNNRFKLWHGLQLIHIQTLYTFQNCGFDGNPQISYQNTALVRTWAQSCTFLSSQEWTQSLKNWPHSVCWHKNLRCVFQLLHLLVIWATLTLSEENCSSRSNSSREGGGISRKVGGKTCNTGHLNVAILLLAKPTTNSKEQYSIAVALSFQTNWGNQLSRKNNFI